MTRPFHLSRRLAVFSALALATAGALAQTGGSVRLLVGYAAGGPVDAAARLIAPVLAKELGANVVVENKPGANATLAGDMVAKGPTDGSLLWFAASPTVTISPNVMKKMAFDPAKDLTPLAPVLSYYNVLVVNKDLPYKSLKDLTDYAKAHPDKLSYGSAGIGGSNHLCGELFAAQTGTKLTHVPYKGNAPAMTDVMGGQITMMFDIIGSARNYISGGKVRAIAVTSPQRNASLPDVPTMAEAGVPGYESGAWFGLAVPAGTPKEIIARLNAETVKALAAPDLVEKFKANGVDPVSSSPEQFAAFVQSELNRWRDAVKAAGLKPE